MRRFRKQYLTGKKPIEDVHRLRLQPYEAVFVGSDQVWNSAHTFGLDDAYMGNMEKGESCRLIAYGASFGKSEPPEKEWPEFKRAMNSNFTAVSIREREGAAFAERLLERPIADVLDPVLLLDQGGWGAFSRTPREKEYILFYAVEPRESMLRFTRALSEASGRPVIQLSPPFSRKREKGFLLRMGVRPEEFTGYFQHASCVVTNSFHGLAFSILFERQFLAFSHSVYHARLRNLLEKFSLERRLMRPEGTLDLSRMEERIDWRLVGECLQRERERSEEFIREGLKIICGGGESDPCGRKE